MKVWLSRRWPLNAMKDYGYTGEEGKKREEKEGKKRGHSGSVEN